MRRYNRLYEDYTRKGPMSEGNLALAVEIQEDIEYHPDLPPHLQKEVHLLGQVLQDLTSELKRIQSSINNVYA